MFGNFFGNNKKPANPVPVTSTNPYAQQQALATQDYFSSMGIQAAQGIGSASSYLYSNTASQMSATNAAYAQQQAYAQNALYKWETQVREIKRRAVVDNLIRNNEGIRSLNEEVIKAEAEVLRAKEKLQMMINLTVTDEMIENYTIIE